MYSNGFATSQTLSAPLPSTSHATICSLREGYLHPLKQNPPSNAPSISEREFENVDLEAPSAAFIANPVHYDPAFPVSEKTSTGHRKSLKGALLDSCRPYVARAASSIQQNTSSSILHSPTKSLASFIPSRISTPNEVSIEAPKSRNSTILGDWFGGSSAPINIGLLPSPFSQQPKEIDGFGDDDTGADMFARIAPPAFARNSTASSAASSAGSKLSSWFSGPVAKSSAASSPLREEFINPDDELLNLSISNSLFPHGSADPLDPSSFHDLLAAAETLLARYQAAYRKQAREIADLTSEQSAQDDELDEAETRARHLKVQLDDMSALVLDQSQKMKTLHEELEAERAARREEEEARIRSLTAVRDAARYSHASCPDDCIVAHGDVISSPLLSSSRHQHKTCLSASSDSGFESDRSSLSSVSVASTAPSTPTHGTAVAMVITRPALLRKQPPPQHRSSTYDQMLGSVDARARSAICEACYAGSRGQHAGAWAVVAKVREENRELSNRVVELEGAVESALDLVAGLGI